MTTETATITTTTTNVDADERASNEQIVVQQATSSYGGVVHAALANTLQIETAQTSKNGASKSKSAELLLKVDELAAANKPNLKRGSIGSANKQ